MKSRIFVYSAGIVLGIFLTAFSYTVFFHHEDPVFGGICLIIGLVLLFSASFMARSKFLSAWAAIIGLLVTLLFGLPLLMMILALLSGALDTRNVLIVMLIAIAWFFAIYWARWRLTKADFR